MLKGFMKKFSIDISVKDSKREKINVSSNKIYYCKLDIAFFTE